MALSPVDWAGQAQSLGAAIIRLLSFSRRARTLSIHVPTNGWSRVRIRSRYSPGGRESMLSLTALSGCCSTVGSPMRSGSSLKKSPARA